ncbi:MAG: hypothetical protein ACRD96_07265 [Bryobacteraceae bacterium]
MANADILHEFFEEYGEPAYHGLVARARRIIVARTGYWPTRDQDTELVHRAVARALVSPTPFRGTVDTVGSWLLAIISNEEHDLRRLTRQDIDTAWALMRAAMFHETGRHRTPKTFVDDRPPRTPALDNIRALLGARRSRRAVVATREQIPHDFGYGQSPEEYDRAEPDLRLLIRIEVGKALRLQPGADIDAWLTALASGKPLRAVADELRTSKSTVQRVYKAIRTRLAKFV